MSQGARNAIVALRIHIDQHFLNHTHEKDPGVEYKLGVDGIVDLTVRGDAKPNLEVTRILVANPYLKQGIFREILRSFASQPFDFSIALSKVNDREFRNILTKIGFIQHPAEDSTLFMTTSDIRKRWP